MVVEAVLLGGLAWLTYANATNSPALIEARESERRGDFPTAIRAATEHLDRRPWSREASRIVARCLSRLDFAEQAEPYYRRSGDLSVPDLRYRAYGLTRANRRDEAIRAFDEILERQPDDVPSLRLKAGLLMAMSRWKDVSKVESPRVEAGQPIAVSRWNDVAEIGRRLSKAPQGMTDVDTPVALGGHWTFRPLSVESVASIGATLEAIAAHNQGDPEEAVTACRKVLALDPELRSLPIERRPFWVQFGEDLLSIGRANEVIRLLNSYDAGRTDADLLELVARAHEQLGAIDEAESCWRRVVELSPAHPSAWLNLGRIESARGNQEEAARWLARAVELAPDSVDAAYNLGLSYRKLGRAEEARNWEKEAARRRLRRDEKAGGTR